MRETQFPNHSVHHSPALLRFVSWKEYTNLEIIPSMTKIRSLTLDCTLPEDACRNFGELY